MNIPSLDAIDPKSYPMPAVDWRESTNYTHHGEDAALWSWEFVRRGRDFQLLTDIRDATHSAQSNGCLLIGDEPDNNEKLLQMYQRDAKIRRLRLSDALVDGLRQYQEFNEELVRAREKHYLSEDHEHKVGFGHVVARCALLRLFPQFREPAGWRSMRPWPDIPGMDRPEILDPEVHRHQMPPWPVKWHGDDLVPENDIRLAIACMDATSIEAYTRTQTVYINTDEETGNIKPQDDCDEVLRVLYDQAVGSVVDFGKRAEYRRLINSDKRKESQIAHIAFDLSAPIQTQLDWADRYLSAMRKRATAASIFVPEEHSGKAEKLPGHLGVYWLRYLDYLSDPEKCTRAKFQRMLGWSGDDSTKWKRLRESALKYRDEIGPRLCDYRTPRPKKSV